MAKKESSPSNGACRGRAGASWLKVGRGLPMVLLFLATLTGARWIEERKCLQNHGDFCQKIFTACDGPTGPYGCWTCNGTPRHDDCVGPAGACHLDKLGSLEPAGCGMLVAAQCAPGVACYDWMVYPETPCPRRVCIPGPN